MKGGAKGASNGVDAISGATITSQALGNTINIWAKYYAPYLKASAEKTCCCGDECETAKAEEE